MFTRREDAMRRMPEIGQLYGNFSMRVFDNKPDGSRELLFRVNKKNQITDDGRLVVLQLLFQDPAGTDIQQNPNYGQIWSLSVGSSSIPPNASQTGLLAPVWTDALVLGTELQYLPPTWQLLVHKEVAA